MYTFVNYLGVIGLFANDHIFIGTGFDYNDWCFLKAPHYQHKYVLFKRMHIWAGD